MEPLTHQFLLFPKENGDQTAYRIEKRQSDLTLATSFRTKTANAHCEEATDCSELLPVCIVLGVMQELLQKMQEKFPSFILIAAGLLDLAGASRHEHHVSEGLGLDLPGEAHPRAASSPVPSKVFSITEDNSDEVTFNFPSPAVESTNEMTADFIPVHSETAAKRAVLPKDLVDLVRDLEVPEQLHTKAAALKLQDGHAFPSKLLSSRSSPVSTEGSQTTTRPEQPDSSLQGKRQNITEAGFSPTDSSSGLPQPIRSRGTQQDSPVFLIPASKQMEVPSPKTSLLTSTVNFHPPRKEIAASLFPTRIDSAFESARVDWLQRGTPPTSERPKDTSPQGQPDGKAGVTPIYLEKTQNIDARVTTSAFLQKPSSGDLGAVYSRMTQTTAIQFSPVLSLKQETTGSKARNSQTAVINGPGHLTPLPDFQTHPQGNIHSSSLLMHLEALGHDDLLPSPFQGPKSTTDRQQPLSFSQTLNCTKQPVSQETNRSSQDISVVVLQRDNDPQIMTSKPDKPRSPGSPQTSANLSSLSQSWMSTLKLFQATKELKGVTSALFPSISTFENAALKPLGTLDSVHAGFQPAGRSSPTYGGLRLTSIPTSAEKGLHIPTSFTSTASGSQVQGISQEVFPMMLQISTAEDSKRKKSLPQQTDKTVSPPLTPQAIPVPSPSELQDNGNQEVPLHSFAPSASQIQQAGSLAAFVSKPLSVHAQGIQSSSTMAHLEPVASSVSDEIPAYLAQALAQQFGMSPDVVTKSLSAFRAGQITSSPYLSFLLKITNGMICLQPMQDSILPTKFPNASVGGLISIQQILVAANSSVLDLANLKSLTPPSLILVKPVFILLPTARPDLHMVPSPEGEDDHKAALFTNKQDGNLGTPESHHDIPRKTSLSYPTSESSRPETALSTTPNQQAEKRKVTSQPLLANSNYTAIPSLFQAITSASNHLLDPEMRISTAVQTMHLHTLPEEMQIPAPDVHGAEGSELLLLNRTLMPFTSTMPLVKSAQHSLCISPKVFLTADRPHSSVLPLLSTKGLPDFQMPAQPPSTVTRSVDQGQHIDQELVLQTTGDHQGLDSTPSSVHTQHARCSTFHSAGTIKYPLKMPTSMMPLQSTSQSFLSTELLRRLPSQFRFVTGTSTAFSMLPAGKGCKDSAMGSMTCSGGATGHAKAAQILTTSVKPDLTKHLEFKSIVPKPFTMTETPTIVPARTPFSAKVQMKTAVSGELLAAITHPRVYTSSPASPPSSVSAHDPLLSAMKRDQIHQTPAKLFSQGHTGENTKPIEISMTSKKIGTSKILGTSTSLSAMFNTRTQQPLGNKVLGSKIVLTPVQPSVSAETTIALLRQPKLIQTTSQSSLAMTSLFAAKNDSVSTLLTKKKVFLLPTSVIQSDPSTVLPTIARVNKSAAVSTSTGKSENVLVERDAATTSQLPAQAPVSSSHQASAQRPLEKVSLEDDTARETGQSSPDSVTRATGLPTSKAFSVSANRLVNMVTNQSALLNKIAVNDAEMLLTGDLTGFVPSPESPSYSSGSLRTLMPHGDSLLGVASTGQSERLLLNTEGEELLRTNEVTEAAAEGLVTALTLLDSEPSVLLSKSHHRRVLQSDATILNGLAVVSDDVCGSGNYTVRMSLHPAAGAGPVAEGLTPSQETFLALITVQSNSSQPVLQVRSCCVTPSASPGGPGAMCCLFHRLPLECRHIQLLQSSKSRAASFTIQLFQMLNRSAAYLHCELNVCLRGKTGCEQDCFESVEPLLQPSDRNSYRNLHNLISFGPVLRTKNKFLYKPLESPDSTMLVPILLGSLTGFAVLGTAFTSLWLHHRQKTKNIRHPQLGEIHGL